MSEHVYDKAQIIALMREIMSRLRRLHVFIPDVLDALNQRGIDITRARFDDMFMTRPERDVIIPLDLLHALIAVFFDFDADSVRADEFLALAMAIRIPIDQVQRYARYFPPSDWQAALHAYGFRVRKNRMPSLLVGRDAILNRLYTLMTQGTNVVLTGAAGIGKTAIALELLRRYEMYNGQPLYYLDVRTIRTLAQLYEQLATVFQVKPLVNEPILLRLQMVLHQKTYYVLLENMDGSEDSLAPTVIIKQLRTHLPMLRYVVTSRIPGTGAQFAGFHEEAIPALDTDHQRAAACQLFMQIYQQSGGLTIDPAYVLASCRAVAGNPLAISMVASAVVRSPTTEPTNDFVWQNISQLNPAEMRIITLVSMTNMPLTRQFLSILTMSDAWGMNEQQLTHALDTLAQRRVVYVVRSDDVVRVEVHAVIRQVIIHVTDEAQMRQLLTDLFQALNQIDMRWEDDVAGEYVFDTHDLQCMLGCIAVLRAHKLVSAATEILSKGRSLWVRYGLCDEAIPLCEQCMAAIGPHHALSNELSFTLGSLYSARGMIPLALTYLQRAYAQAITAQHMELACRAAGEIGMNGIIDTSKPPQVSFETICMYFESAIAYLDTHANVALRASIYDLYAYVMLAAGNIRDALTYNDRALAIFRTANSTRGLIDAHFNRGLILLTTGEFMQAQQALSYAKAEYERLRIPLGRAQCSLRLAAIAVLSGDAPTTRSVLADAVAVLYRAGGIQDMLYVMDIYCGLLLLQGAFAETVDLCGLVEYFRTERHIFRGRQLDLVFQQQLHIARQQCATLSTPTITRFAQRLTFYEVIRFIRADLLGE